MGEALAAKGFELTDAGQSDLQLIVVFHKDYGITRAAADREPQKLVEAWTQAWSDILASLESDLRAHFSAAAAPSS